MLREAFPKYYRSYQRSPWVDELDEFSTWLANVGYSHRCACNHLCRLRQVLDRTFDHCPNAAFTVVQLDKAFSSISSPSQSPRYRATQRAFQSFLAARGRLVTPPTSFRFETLRLGYRQYLAELRGLTAVTIQQHDTTVRDFLSLALGPNQDLTDLTGRNIETYVLARGSEIKRQTLQHTVARLRSFLRYAYERGEIRSKLAEIIDTPRIYRDELPPRAMDWELVQKLLNSINRVNRIGWRDYTILHLMAYYGLRPSEIVTLHRDSIDWKTGVLHVKQCKTRSSLELPLTALTISVLRCYFSHVWPGRKHPELFVRARSPAGALKATAITNIFKKWARQSGLPLNRYSPYSLRHSFAMRLLERGVGVKAIGDLLGHRSLESTCQYLRLDVNVLRQVALSVPHVEQVRRP
jgi:site-specific recombinase XerD